jgi:hypothetical protein
MRPSVHQLLVLPAVVDTGSLFSGDLICATSTPQVRSSLWRKALALVKAPDCACIADHCLLSIDSALGAPYGASSSATAPRPPSVQMLTIARVPGGLPTSSLVAWLRIRAPVAPKG